MLFTVDIGTTNFKAAVFDFDGNCLFLTEVPLINKTGSIFEFDSSQWLKSFEDCCARAGNLSGIEAIVICGNGPTLVPVTAEHEKVLDGFAHNARLWLDRRAVKYQEEVSEAAGGFVDSCFFLPKVLKIKNEEYELYKSVKHFIGCPEYLAYALTGKACTVFPSEGFDRWFWNDAVLKKLNLDAEKFPPFINAGDQFGTITPSAAVKYGFKKNIPVISGGPDFFTAILGAGVTEPSTGCGRTGSSEGINICTLNRVNDRRLMSYSHPVKPFWNLSGVINTTGKAVQWGCSFLGIESYEDFFSLAKKSQKGSGGLVFLPYLAGERAPVWDSQLRGLWKGLSLSSEKSGAANSILEGICFAVRDVLETMEETGERVKHLRLTGKMAANAYLNQMKADISGKEIIEVKQKEAELLGLAVIGSCYLGKYKSYKEASNKMVKIDNHYEPDVKNADVYNQLFNEYKESRNFYHGSKLT